MYHRLLPDCGSESDARIGIFNYVFNIAANRGQSDLSKGCRQIRRSSGAARFDGGYDWRRGIRRHGHALQRSRLRGAVQSLFGVYEKIRRIVSASIVKPLHGSKILLVFRGFHYRRATS